MADGSPLSSLVFRIAAQFADCLRESKLEHKCFLKMREGPLCDTEVNLYFGLLYGWYGGVLKLFLKRRDLLFEETDVFAQSSMHL